MRPLLNKDTAFSDDERARFSLHGLLPPELQTFEQQVVRAYGGFTRGINHELERHIYLPALQDTNKLPFYRLFLDHIEKMTPIVYTLTVAAACEQLSHISRRPRGCSFHIQGTVRSASSCGIAQIENSTLSW